MNEFFKSKNIKIVSVVLLLISIALIGYYGYNEYTYQKITTCVAEGNYNLAENYIDSISPNYKDLRKIKSLIETIDAINAGNTGDLERAYSRLENLKGFENEKVNSVYNSLLFSIYKDLVNNNIYQNTYTANTPTISYTESPVPETTLIASNENSDFHQTETQTYANISTTAVTSISTVSETTIPSTTETITYTTELSTTTIPTTVQTTTYITTTKEYVSPATTQQPTTLATTLPYYSTGTVYYVESGEVYHINPDCRTLARSTNIFSGPIPEGRRACKVCSQ